MIHLQPWLLPVRTALTTFSGREAMFWLVTALIALLLPSPIAGPVLTARLRRPPPQE